MKIAIIGSGISGLSLTYLLDKKYDVTLFEESNYIGGHANTATIKYKDKNIAVDTGFIVFNFKTYPNLKAFFALLKVEISKSNMSFGIKNLDNNFEYSGNNLASIFAQKKNLLKPKFYKMLFDIIRFNQRAIKFVEDPNQNTNLTLAKLIKKWNLGDYFQEYYLLPMAAAIWSCPLKLMKNYPAKTFLQFFYNHGLLTVTKQPQWYSVKGGSREYVAKIVSNLVNKPKLNSKVIKVYHTGEKITLITANKQRHQFDHVIFANHPDQILNILSDATSSEKNILQKIKYSKNTAILHNDVKQMPKKKKAWASWVYLASNKSHKVSLTYWMNNLQNISAKYPLFVTLNPLKKIAKKNIFGIFHYEHPIFNQAAITAQNKLSHIQGKRNIWFCGAWTKYGFHEDGLNSALKIATKFNVKAPWLK
ncbi:MAG: NAD(P)/FAD-dependent oxidoreductase [Rickettsiales bacterium]